MRISKKILAIALSILMAITMMPFTVFAATLPTATVTDITDTAENTEGLDAAFKFVANNDGVGYDDYQADYIVRFNRDVTSDELELWGQYGSHPWTNLASEASGGSVTYAADTDYYLLKDIIKWQITYEQAVAIGTFYCGVKDNNAEAGTKMTVKLAIYDDTAATVEPIQIGDTEEYVVPAAEKVLPTATVTDITDTAENTEGLDAAFKFVANNDGVGYDDYQADYIVRFNREVTSDELELWGQYGSHPWTNLASEASGGSVTYAADTDYYLLKDIIKWQITYEQAVAIGTFYCGVKDNNAEAGTKMTVKLAIYDDTAATVEPIQIGDTEEYVVPASSDKFSITVKDEIDLNIYVSKTADIAELKVTSDANIAEEDASQAATSYKGSALAALTTDDGFYKVVVPLAPAQIRDAIKVEILDANGDTVRPAIEKTVADYCEDIIAGAYVGDDADQVITLAKATLDYGKAAADYFGYNVAAFANQPDYYDDAALGDYAKGSATGIKIEDVALRFTSQAELRFYVKAGTLTEEEAANLNVQSDIGTASFTKLDDGTVILQVIDIPASDLGKEIHITGDVTVSYTPLRWAKAVIDNNIGSAKLQRLANAVITYSNAADSIF